jgi:Bifunctional DNA primase/polymerase, N-terminal
MTRQSPTRRPPGISPVLEQALAYAARGWPVLPCQPGGKTPATEHGSRDATTDPARITAWFTRHPGRNLAIATGHPGPDVLDIDIRPAGSGYPALRRLALAGLTASAAAWIRTPGGGLHAYYTGTTQRNGHLPRHHLDFRSAGGYVLAPPSAVNGRPYQVARVTGRNGTLDWAAVTALLDPQPRLSPVPARPGDHADPGRLAAWVARLSEGNRNAGLFWAACRLLDTSHDTGALALLAGAARHAGLGDAEIHATLRSAIRTTSRQAGRDTHAEAEARELT